MNHKKFLTLQEQIDFLEKKNIHVPKTLHSKQILRDVNYYNIISCSKVKFATGRDLQGKYIYRESHFKDWIGYFRKDCHVSEHLMRNLLRFERIINSRTAYAVSSLFESDSFSDMDRKSLIMAINVGKKSGEFNGENAWVVINKKTFGQLRYIIRWLWKNNQREVVREIFNGYEYFNTKILRKLDEIVNLRNNIFHFRPLNIYLVYGTNSNKASTLTNRQDAVKEIFYQQPNKRIKEDMAEMFSMTREFSQIKNSQPTLTENLTSFFPRTRLNGSSSEY